MRNNTQRNGFRIRLMWVILFILFFLNAKSQPKHFDVLPSMPTPTVASMSRYCEFPEIDQNGTVPIEIPLWDFSYKGISIPIKLKYNSTGVRVGQESTWVGLGWNLEGLGFISRSVRDLPDDIISVQIIQGGRPYLTYNGYLRDNCNYYEDFPEKTNNPEGTIEEKSAFFLSSNEFRAATTRHDAEPDVYFLKIGEIQEQFVFDHTGRIAFINPKQN